MSQAQGNSHAPFGFGNECVERLAKAGTLRVLVHLHLVRAVEEGAALSHLALVALVAEVRVAPAPDRNEASNNDAGPRTSSPAEERSNGAAEAALPEDPLRAVLGALLQALNLTVGNRDVRH